MRASLTVAVSVLLMALFSSFAAASDDKTPFSQGEYEIRLNGQRIGQEQFRVFQDKRPVIEITHVLYYPEPSRRELRYELESGFEPRKLEIVSTRGGIVTELKLERKGDNWRAEVEGQGRKKKRHELGRIQGTVVDFDSPLFDSITLGQLRLNVGETRNVDAVTLMLPDFFAAREPQAFTRVEDEELETQALGKLNATVYEQNAQGAVHRLWLSPAWVVLKETFEKPGNEEMEIVLTRLRTEPGKGVWP